MKKKLTVLFLFIGMSSTFAQKDVVVKEAEKMYEDTYNMNFDGILNATYPKIFEIADRDMLYQTMNNSFQNDDFGIRLVYPKVVFNVSEIKETEGKKVALITYNNTMRMTFTQQMSNDESKMMLSNLQQAMVGKKVTHEPDRNSFLIEGEETMIAISDEHTNNTWKFITYDKSQKPMLVHMLGEKTLEKLEL